MSNKTTRTGGKFGFINNTKYVLTTYDAICAVIGSSDGENTTAADVSGTVTSIRIITDTVRETSENHETLLVQEIKLINIS